MGKREGGREGGNSLFKELIVICYNSVSWRTSFILERWEGTASSMLQHTGAWETTSHLSSPGGRELEYAYFVVLCMRMLHLSHTSTLATPPPQPHLHPCSCTSHPTHPTHSSHLTLVSFTPHTCLIHITFFSLFHFHIFAVTLTLLPQYPAPKLSHAPCVKPCPLG